METSRNAKSGKPLIIEQDEDEFMTDPNFPDLHNAQNRDHIPIPDPTYNSKKRRYIDNMKTSEPRKVSRNIAESHLADYSEMSEVSCHDVI